MVLNLAIRHAILSITINVRLSIQVVHTDPEELGIYKGYANPISNAQKKHKIEVELCELADIVVPVGPKLYKAFHSYLASCKREQCFFEFTPGILAEFSELKQAGIFNLKQAEFSELKQGLEKRGAF